MCWKLYWNNLYFLRFFCLLKKWIYKKHISSSKPLLHYVCWYWYSKFHLADSFYKALRPYIFTEYVIAVHVVNSIFLRKSSTSSLVQDWFWHRPQFSPFGKHCKCQGKLASSVWLVFFTLFLFVWFPLQ